MRRINPLNCYFANVIPRRHKNPQSKTRLPRVLHEHHTTAGRSYARTPAVWNTSATGMYSIWATRKPILRWTRLFRSGLMTASLRKGTVGCSSRERSYSLTHRSMLGDTSGRAAGKCGTPLRTRVSPFTPFGSGTLVWQSEITRFQS